MGQGVELIFKSILNARRAIGIAVAAGMLAIPAPAMALRYASPSGSSANNCQTPATACDLEVAIDGDGALNVPSADEEIVVLTGTYPTPSQNINMDVFNLNVHGEGGQPRPVINVDSASRWTPGNDTISYLRFEKIGNTEAINLSGGTLDRVFMLGIGSGTTPNCQCYGGLVSNSVFITGGSHPAIGVHSNGGDATMTYRNVTAYSDTPGVPAIDLIQQHPTLGTLNFTIHNTIALNQAGGTGTEIRADGPNTTVTLSNSNYRNAVEQDTGDINDAPGSPHQTALPQFTDLFGGDLSETANSPTINCGNTDPLNGTLDFAGSARTIDGFTDIGAHEFAGATGPCSGTTPPGTGNPSTTTPPPSTTPAKVHTRCKKRKKKRKKPALAAAGCKKKKRKK